jgi:AcrR family transcriptional regulator
MSTTLTTRDAILAAARTLASRCGPDGFTVLDVSREAQVSHTTIYNHFEGRQQMLEVLATNWNMSVVDEAARKAVSDHPSDAMSALEAFVIGMASRKHAMRLVDARLFDAYHFVLDANPALRAPYLMQVHRVMADLLREGSASGQLSLLQGHDMARAIMILTVKFSHAVFIEEQSLGELEEQISFTFRHVFRPLLQA